MGNCIGCTLLCEEKIPSHNKNENPNYNSIKKDKLDDLVDISLDEDS
jgi:hypothetical protein